MSDATHRRPRRPHAVHGTKARRLSPVKLNHVSGRARSGGAVAGQNFATPRDGGTGVRIFGEPPRPGAVQDGGDISQLPKSPAPLTTGSGSELKRGRRRRPTFFRGGLLLEFDFICITTTTRAEKPFRGNLGGWDKFKAGR